MSFENFCSGSSREHALGLWLIMVFRVVIAPSFADIFKNNALGNDLLTIELTKDEVLEIVDELKKSQDKNIEISLLEKKSIF